MIFFPPRRIIQKTQTAKWGRREPASEPPRDVVSEPERRLVKKACGAADQ